MLYRFGLRFRAGLRSINRSSLSVSGVCLLVWEHFVLVRKIRLNVKKKSWPADSVYFPMSTVVWEVPSVLSLSESCTALSARLCRYRHQWQDNQPFIFSSSSLPLLTSFEQMSQLCWFCIKRDWLCVCAVTSVPTRVLILNQLHVQKKKYWNQMIFMMFGSVNSSWTFAFFYGVNGRLYWNTDKYW